MHEGTPDGRRAFDYRVRRPALYRHDSRARGRVFDYLDFGKKLFSLFRFRKEPVPITMAAAVGMPAGLARPADLAARALLATVSQNNGFTARRHKQ
ncbi:hypothetical protein [Burkholderia cepacia]|uniref:hypothetical protein n=1 Tax=Burkholderia cepacia TaxID=292 RepID=UPI00398E8FDA